MKCVYCTDKKLCYAHEDMRKFNVTFKGLSPKERLALYKKRTAEAFGL